MVTLKDPRLLVGLGVLAGTGILYLAAKKTVLRPALLSEIKLTRHLDERFFQGVAQMAADYRSRGASISAMDLLAVFLGESGVHPDAMNASSGCAGLNQICDLRGVGWSGTRQEYLRLTAAEQLPYVRAFFDQKPMHALRDAGSLYLANFNPGHLGQPDGFVLYQAGSTQYAQNAILDNPGGPKKGYIEVADMKRYMDYVVRNHADYWRELSARMAPYEAWA